MPWSCEFCGTVNPHNATEACFRCGRQRRLPLRQVGPSDKPYCLGPNARAYIERMDATNTLAVARIEGDLNPASGIFPLTRLRQALDHAEALGAEDVELYLTSSHSGIRPLLVVVPKHADGSLSRACVLVAPEVVEER